LEQHNLSNELYVYNLRIHAEGTTGTKSTTGTKGSFSRATRGTCGTREA